MAEREREVTRRNRRPRFNGSPSDHDDTQYFTRLRTDEADGTGWPAGPGTFGGVSDIGVMAIAIGPAGPAPLAGYQPAPASFPALPAAPGPEPLPDWERDLLDEQARQMALPVLRDVPVTERAVIGDELRLPVIWCEMPSCINWHLDRESAGEQDARARARAAGWRTDALGRLACPGCQQSRSDYRTPQPAAWYHPEVRRQCQSTPDGTRHAVCGQPWIYCTCGHGGPSETEMIRLAGQAEYGRRINRRDPALARDIIDATSRHHRTVTS